MSRDELAITPPQSFGPPTPPQSCENLERREQYRETLGKLLTSCNSHSVLALKGGVEDFERLETDLSLHPQRKRDRLDYQDGKIEVSMPTPVHENFIADLVSDLLEQLSEFKKEEGPAGVLARSLGYKGSERLEFVTPKSERLSRYQPDAVFTLNDATWPSIIIEVAYHQNWKRVRRLADTYILGSDGDVQYVIGFKIYNRESQEARFSVWRPLTNDSELRSTTILKDQVFRNKAGEMQDCADIEIPLHSLSMDPSVEPTSCYLKLDHLMLFCSLKKAEERQNMIERGEGRKSTLSEKIKKRPLSSSSDDGLGSTDEENFRISESLVEKNAEEGDDDYQPPNKRSCR